ncbi:unnamed protein product [Mytilus edulis]|uniref:Ig-like domain-containing protein n=1 Tax=Mytilus edulis TaxID=6550 RepID=A0A8S3QD50_MYTED|nr:unnamed protein product [Mytilus edulis]
MIASSQIPPGPPVIDGPQVIVLNSQITLTCTSARGDPPPTVKWLKDHIEITTGVSTTTVGTSVTTSLTFTATLDDHIEVYECQAENGVLQNPLTTTKFIEVHCTPPITSIPQPSYTQISGQQVILGCTVNSPNSPLQEVQWTFTNNQGKTTDPISILNSNGKYSGSSVNSPSLTINSLPVVQINPSTYTATYGSQVIINCNIVSASPAATQVYWQRSSNNQILRIDNGDQGYQGSTTSTPSLTINFVTTDNAGVYTCFATNAVGTGTSNQGTVILTGGDLHITVSLTTYSAITGDSVVTILSSNKPPGQPIITGSQRHDLGDTVTLSCSSTGGNPLPIVNWLRDDNIITTGINRFSGREKGKIIQSQRDKNAFKNEQQQIRIPTSSFFKPAGSCRVDSNRREMHVYNTPQDNEEYSTIPADHVFVDPNHTNLKRDNTYLEPNHSNLKQNHTILKPDNNYLEPGHSIVTPNNVSLKLGHIYFQPISGKSMTSTT